MKQQGTTTRRMIAFLSDPANLPASAKKVKIVQTHASIVALTESHAFKVKKPFDFGFMDFSTLEKRKANATREVKLNSRFCENVYLGVLPISEDEKGELTFGEAQKVVDYAVYMNRLKDGYFLNQLLEKGTGSGELMQLISGKLANYYKSQQSNKEISAYGKISHIKQITKGNFDSMTKFPKSILNPLILESLKQVTNSFIDQHQKAFEQRVAAGKILECHGDLRLDHIHYKDGKLNFYDCIEFNKAFRSVDIANDIAFLTMDLEHKSYIRESEALTKLMIDKLKDPDLADFMHFYKIYRACVRGKVHAYAALEDGASSKNRKIQTAISASFFKLAMQYACTGQEQTAIILFGPPASGKSTLAKSVAKLLNCTHINSDVIRKKLFGLDIHKPSPESLKSKIYSAESGKLVYDRMLKEAGLALEKSKTVILDASYNSVEKRQSTAVELKKKGIKPVFVYLSASPSAIKSRLKMREKAKKTISDARSADFDNLVKTYLPPQEGEIAATLIKIDSSEKLEKLTAVLVEKLISRENKK